MRIIPPTEHGIKRSQLSDAVCQVLCGLHEAGYRACLVGGAVRDLLLGIQPKDFDVATDAHPQEICRLFKKARIIGRRFQIVHVRSGREIIEVTTFRANPSEKPSAKRQVDASGLVLRDNVFGDIEQDASRRDFAINGLYYDIADEQVYDYQGGLEDIQAKRLRLIGEAGKRYKEDPVRMLRAVRLAAKSGVTIDPASEPPAELICRLHDVPAARLFDESLKLFMHPSAPKVFAMLRERGLLKPLFPQTVQVLDAPEGGASEALISKAIANTAQRIVDGRSVTPAFIFAALLWPAVRQRAKQLEDEDVPLIPALAIAQREVIGRQIQRVSMPKRFSIPMREIWQLQPRFHKRRGKQPRRLLGHPRFRAAYDFLLLRAEVGEVTTELAQWWTDIQEDETIQPIKQAPRRRKKRRRHKRAQGG